MLDTFIKNKGITKTIIHNNNKNYYNEVNWDADYDGENANISLDIDDNGNKQRMEMTMNNNQLIELLNIPSENTMLDERLYNDFLSNDPKHEYEMIEIPKSILDNNLSFTKDSLEKYKKKVHFENDNIDNNFHTHISSPVSQEEIIFPLIMNETKTRKHRLHKKSKPRGTHKIYRKIRHHSPSHKKTSKKHKQRVYSRRTF